VSRAADIVSRARAREWTLTTAESCTGGKVAAALTDVAGASSVFERGYVTYSNQAKTDLLGVRQETLRTHGAVSEAVALEMAKGALVAAGAHVAVAITGIAGPGGSEFKPEGRVCYGLATTEGVWTHTIDHGALGRANVRTAATQEALRMFMSALA